MNDILRIVLEISLIVLMIGAVMGFVRLIRGPRLQDRVVAIDLLASLGVVIIVIQAIATNEPALIDVAILIALISFLGTVAFAYYGERMFG